MVARKRRVVSVPGTVAQQRLGVSRDRGERGLELVGDVGHEVAPHRLQTPHLGEVVDDQDGASGGERPRVHEKGALVHLELPILHRLAGEDRVHDLARRLHPEQLRGDRAANRPDRTPGAAGPRGSR